MSGQNFPQNKTGTLTAACLGRYAATTERKSHFVHRLPAVDLGLWLLRWFCKDGDFISQIVRGGWACVKVQRRRTTPALTCDLSSLNKHRVETAYTGVSVGDMRGSTEQGQKQGLMRMMP